MDRSYPSSSYYQEPMRGGPGRGPGPGPGPGDPHSRNGFYRDGPGLNDQPLQFNGEHLPRNTGNSQPLLDPLYSNQTGFGSHGGVGSMSGIRNGPVPGLPGYDMSRTQQEPFRGNGYILYPDDTGRSIPPLRERPLGCRTVLLEGIPVSLTDDMARDMCERIGGPIEFMERGSGPFYQLRFLSQEGAVRAFAIHGMHICINNSKAPQCNGRLLIDYVVNPQDQYEYEQEQRRIIMEQHHQDTAPVENLTLMEFSNPAMERITDCIKEENILGDAIQVIISWLEKGQCNKRTANQFYRLISLTNSHVRRLQNEKAQSDKEFEQAKQHYINCKRGIVMQLTLLEQVHTSAAKKKVWDHFTKAQRKNLDQWRQTVKDLKAKEEKELRPEEAGEADMEIESEDEEAGTVKGKGQQKSSLQNIILPQMPEVIDVSDEEDKNEDDDQDETEETEKEGGAEVESPPEKKVKMADPAPKVDEEALKRLKEIEDLRLENEEMKNQIETLKREESSMKEKETQIKALQLAFVNMQQQLKETKAKLKTEEESRKARESEATSGSASLSSSAEMLDKTSESAPSMPLSRGGSESQLDSSKNDGPLLSFISIFLHAHPFGASIDYLWSYLSRLQPHITQSEIEKVLRKHSNCFTQELTGVGASLERRWKFVAFDNALKKS